MVEVLASAGQWMQVTSVWYVQLPVVVGSHLSRVMLKHIPMCNWRHAETGVDVR